MFCSQPQQWMNEWWCHDNQWRNEKCFYYCCHHSIMEPLSWDPCYLLKLFWDELVRWVTDWNPWFYLTVEPWLSPSQWQWAVSLSAALTWIGSCLVECCEPGVIGWWWTAYGWPWGGWLGDVWGREVYKKKSNNTLYYMTKTGQYFIYIMKVNYYEGEL